MAVFQTLASCFSSAIERDRIRKAREAAERKALIERERAARADELEAANKVLSVRDKWLQTTAAAANELLSTTDVPASVNAALATIGENLECDRVSVMQHIVDDNAASDADELGIMRLLYEWDAEGIAAQNDNPNLRDISADGVEDWFRQILAGQSVGGLVEALEEPFRSSMQSLNVKSTYAVPVFVEGKIWGMVGMDHCRESRQLSSAELAVFETAATCVGSAIYQATVRRDKAAQERAQLLSSVAQVANLLLRSADYVAVLPEVTRLLGEAVGSDRCSVTQDVIHQPTGQLAVKPLEEWCSEGLAPVEITAPDFLEDGLIPMKGDFLAFHQSLMRGEVVNFLVSDVLGKEKKLMEAQGNTSMLIVPIMVRGQCWGEIGFDNCGEPRLYDEAETAILQIAAESIAGAIARQAQEDSVREAEERYRALIELSTEGIYRLELDAPIARDLPVLEQVNLFYQKCYGAEANAAFTAMYGYQNPAEMIGWRLTDIHVEASEQNTKFLNDWLANPDCQISNSESEEIDVDGNIHYFLNNVTGIVEDGYLVRVWGTQTDITELKQAQKAQEAAEKAILEEREKAARDRATKLAETNEAISRTLSTLATNPEPNNFLCLLVQELSNILGAHNTGLFLYNKENNTLSRYIAVQDSTAYIGKVPRDTEMLQHPFPADITDIWNVIVDSRQPLTFIEVDDPESNARNLWWEDTIDWHMQEGHQQAAFARMKVGDLPIGFIGFCFREHKTFSAEQLELIQALANQATLSIHLTRLAEEAKQTAILQEQEKAARDRATELAKTNEALSKTLSALTETPDPDEFLGQILASICQHIEACTASLFLYDEATHSLNQHLTVQDGQTYQDAAPTDPDMFRHPIPADLSDAWQVITASKKPFTMDERHPENNAIMWPESVPWHEEKGHVSATCACMKVGNKPVGFIGFAFRHFPTLSDEQLEFIQSLTNQATLSIHLTRLAEEAKQTAILQEQEKAARDRAAQLTRANQALKRSLDLLAQQPELEAFLQGVVNEAAAQTEAATGHLFLYDAAADACWLRVATDNNGDWRSVPDMALWSQPVPIDEAPDFWAKIFERKAFIVEDLKTTLQPGPHIWEPSIAWHLRRGHTSFICAPLVLGEQAIGFLGLSFVGETKITQEAVELAQALTNQATLAIQFTRLAEEAQENAVLQEQEKAASQRAAQLASSNESISKTLTNLAARPELDEFLGYILAEMSRQLEAGKVHLFLYDAPTHTLSQRVVVQDGKIYLGAAPTDPDLLHHPIPADLTPAWKTILSSGERLTYDENTPYDKDLWWPETVEWHQSQGHKSVTCIPMKAGEQPIGYIGFCFYNSTIITDEQQEFMQALANQAIVAIQLTRLAEEAKQTAILQEQEKAARDRAVELAKTNEALGQTLSVLTTTPELDDFLGQVLCKISQPVQACKALLFLYNEDTHTLHAHLSVHDGQQVYKGTAPNDPEMFHHPIPADLSPAWNRIINSSKPWILDENNPADADLWWPDSLPWNKAEGHCAVICAVMKVGGNPIGFIALTFRIFPILTNEQLEFIQALTNQATLAVHLTRLAEQSKTAALTNVLTNERNRLAREIHDTLAQSFTGVSLQLEAAKGILSSDPETARTYVKRAGKLARQGLSEARRSVRALRSQALETDTLPTALQIALTEMTQESPVQTEFQLTGTPYPLPEDIQTNLLRIGQEAITNTLRHANAKTLRLTLQFHPHHIQMSITDDGQGSAITSLAEVEGFGLLGMRERVLRFDGQFTFNSTPGRGTVIDITMPAQEER
ncbi:MAG: GAF domain-containing protein [Cyanobacteria bacterium J06649_5]